MMATGRAEQDPPLYHRLHGLVKKRWRWLLIVPVLLVFSVTWLSCFKPSRQPQVPPAGMAYITVLTYNVNFGLGGDPEGLQAIEDIDADVVFLQETTPEWEQAIRQRLAGRYPHMAFRHCCGAGGLAVLSKLPVTPREYERSKAGWFPAWRFVVQAPFGPLQVLAVHLRPPVSDSGSVVSGYFSTPSIREAEVKQFYSLLDPNLPTLVVGDLNENRRGKAVAYLKGRGFRSVLNEYRSSNDTWRWKTSVGTVHAELDHLLYNHKLEPLDARVEHRGRSDHWPVVGLFKLRKHAAKTK